MTDKPTKYEALGRRLEELLEGPYAKWWFATVAGVPGQWGRNRRIAETLRRCPFAAEKLDLGEVTEDALEARVRRLLGGSSASGSLVEAIITCAEFSQQDGDEVRQLLIHSEKPLDAGPGERGRAQQRGAKPWLTLHLSERHTVGAGGSPVRHLTRQTIIARRPMDRYPYRIDAAAATVEVLEGGTAGDLRFVDGFYVVDVVFPRRLKAGDEFHFEYETTLAYQEPPEPRLRRATLSDDIASVEMIVEFHPDRLPSSVWRTEWEPALAEAPSKREPYELIDSRAVWTTPLGAGTAAGFTWAF